MAKTEPGWKEKVRDALDAANVASAISAGEGSSSTAVSRKQSVVTKGDRTVTTTTTSTDIDGIKTESTERTERRGS